MGIYLNLFVHLCALFLFIIKFIIDFLFNSYSADSVTNHTNYNKV